MPACSLVVELVWVMEKRVQSSFKSSHSLMCLSQKKTSHDHHFQRETPKYELITNNLHSFCVLSLFLWAGHLVPSGP